MLTVPDSVLLVIDVQEKLFHVMYQKEQLADNLQRLIKGIQVLEVPVLVTEQYPRGLGPNHSGNRRFIAHNQAVSEGQFQLLRRRGFSAGVQTTGTEAGVDCGH